MASCDPGLIILVIMAAGLIALVGYSFINEPDPTDQPEDGIGDPRD